MNYLIPLMVIIPILAALIVNIFGGKDKTVKAISIVVAIAIPVIAIIAAVGIQYFGGHDPALLASSLPSIMSLKILKGFSYSLWASLHSWQY